MHGFNKEFVCFLHFFLYNFFISWTDETFNQNTRSFLYSPKNNTVWGEIVRWPLVIMWIQRPRDRSPPLFPNLGDTCCVCYKAYAIVGIFFIIDRFELSSHYISYWKLFWQISYRKDTLLKGVPNSCWMSRGMNSNYLKARILNPNAS